MATIARNLLRNSKSLPQILRGGIIGRSDHINNNMAKEHQIVQSSFVSNQKTHAQVPNFLFRGIGSSIGFPAGRLGLVESFNGKRMYGTDGINHGDSDGDRPGGALRPLSPHLPIYKPQRDATFSISNRISGSFLVAIVLVPYLLCLKMGLICFTYPSFYQFLFYSSKIFLISAEIAALALAYHLYHGVLHLWR